MKHKHKFTVKANGVEAGDDGVIKFPNGLVITDTSTQWNGTQYDIESMDLSEYNKGVTIDHSWSVTDIVGKVEKIRKTKTQVVVDSIKFAVMQSALAKFVYDMMKENFITDFSIETIGDPPDSDGVYKQASLVGLSIVTVGNNKSARINELALNSIKESKENGLDTSLVENLVFPDNADEENDHIDHNENSPIHNEENGMKYVTIRNGRKFAVTVTYKNAAGEEVESTLEPDATVDVSEDQKEALENQISSFAEPTPDISGAIEKAVNAAVGPMLQKMQDMEQKMFNSAAKEPAFQANIKTDKISDDWRENYQNQINHAWDYLKGGSQEAQRKLIDINKYNLEGLKKAGIVQNVVTIADFGNFVISPELVNEIQGARSNYQGLLGRLNFEETLSTQMAWLTRSGDISMSEVVTCDDGADGNLKPISEYSATSNTVNLRELAAVTPVCDAATRFLAADLLGDIVKGYRTDYDRKRAQLFIAKAQQAINATGYTTAFATTSDVNSVKAWVDLFSSVSEFVENGTYVMTYKSYARLLKAAIGAGISGPLSNLFVTGDMPSILGNEIILVPNDLMPTLDSSETKSFTVDSTAVTINQAVIYADLSVFKGRTSGGLKYDLSTEAAYEVDGTVYSAYQRNELVIRGSFFRNGAIVDTARVSGLGAPGVS